jgi:hypothetical protein
MKKQRCGETDAAGPVQHAAMAGKDVNLFYSDWIPIQNFSGLKKRN